MRIFGVILVRMRENRHQNNSEYGHFLRSIFVRKIFCKLLSKYLWQSLFLVKFHAFSTFFSTPLDRCVWILKIVFEEVLDVKTTFRLKKSHIAKNFWWKQVKNESRKCYLGNKEQKAIFLVVSRSDLHFSIEHTFFACSFGCAILLVKIRHLEKKLSTPGCQWFN